MVRTELVFEVRLSKRSGDRIKGELVRAAIGEPEPPMSSLRDGAYRPKPRLSGLDPDYAVPRLHPGDVAYKQLGHSSGWRPFLPPDFPRGGITRCWTCTEWF